MASTNNGLIPNTAEPSKPLISLAFPTCTQLTDTSYRSWRYQITRLLQGYGLFSYLDGSNPAPPETLSVTPPDDTTSPSLIPNPAYSTWFRQDQLIIGALAGTIHKDVSPVILDANTSHELWTTLETTYGNPSRGHILQVKDRLRSISLGDKSISAYMLSIKACTTQLAHLGKPMDAEDITSQIINGLDYALYKPVIDADLPEAQRADAVSSMVYEANARLRDPVYGCAGAICQLQNQISELQAELAKSKAEIVNMQCQQANLIALICMHDPNIHVTPPSPQNDAYDSNTNFLNFYDDNNSINSIWDPLWT
ncbi:hypothetical protein KSS87_018143 [Heliosperma pusillum]|nr:hypothetical protein KSS87_018143 [Heliosperma pusillum]